MTKTLPNPATDLLNRACSYFSSFFLLFFGGGRQLTNLYFCTFVPVRLNVQSFKSPLRTYVWTYGKRNRFSRLGMLAIPALFSNLWSTEKKVLRVFHRFRCAILFPPLSPPCCRSDQINCRRPPFLFKDPLPHLTTAAKAVPSFYFPRKKLLSFSSSWRPVCVWERESPRSCVSLSRVERREKGVKYPPPSPHPPSSIFYYPRVSGTSQPFFFATTKKVQKRFHFVDAFVPSKFKLLASTFLSIIRRGNESD